MLLQSTWKEERIIYDLSEAWEKRVKLIIFIYRNQSLSMGSVRECNPLGKQGSGALFSEGTSFSVNMNVCVSVNAVFKRTLKINFVIFCTKFVRRMHNGDTVSLCLSTCFISETTEQIFF
jgi:hypothetical protein